MKSEEGKPAHHTKSAKRPGHYMNHIPPAHFGYPPQVPGDVGENTDPTLVVLQPLKPALQLDFFIIFLLFQFVATSLKIVELNCSFYFTIVDHQL